MKCDSCAYEFSKEKDGTWLTGVASFAGGTLKCPRCGQEIRVTPDLRKLFGKQGKHKVGGTR